MPKPYERVRVDKIPAGYEKGFPWKEGDILLFLSEIVEMPGHCAVVDRKGKVYWGYHTDNFRSLTDDEK